MKPHIAPRTCLMATALAAVLAVASGCTSPTPTAVPTLAALPTLAAPVAAPRTEMPETTMATPSSAVLTQLAALPVKGRAPKTGYTRAQFDQPWTDDNNADGGHNGCDTRNDVLRRDLTDLVIKPGSSGCSVLSGTLHDPYTATTIAFTRGADTSSRVQIDHVVALSDAWQTGAQQLTAAQRVDLANDLRNLQAVDGPTNQAKSDSDAASWLPPNKSYRCIYVTRQIQVKTMYHLWVTAAEKAAMQQQLTRCLPGSVMTASPTVLSPTAAAPAPVSSGTPTLTLTPTVATAALPATPTTDSAPPSAADVHYRSCAAVRAAGKAPLMADQPGYRSGLDRDHDGMACET